MKTEDLVVMQLLSLADGTPTPMDGHFLVAYDPSIEGRDSTGKVLLCKLETSPNLKDALKLPFLQMAELWRKSYGMRPDNQPNRPLTAFSVVLIPLGEAEKQQ